MKRTRRTAAIISSVFLLSAGGVTLAAPAQAADTALAYAALSQVQDAPDPDPMVPELPMPVLDPSARPEVPALDDPPLPEIPDMPPTLPLPEPVDPPLPEIPQLPEVPEVPEVPAPVPTEPPAGESLICSLLPSLGLGDQADAVVSAVFDC